MDWEDQNYCLEQCLQDLLTNWRTLEEKREYIRMQARLKGARFAQRLKERYVAEVEGGKE